MTISQTRLRKLRQLERRKAKPCPTCKGQPTPTPCPDCPGSHTDAN